MYNTFLLFIIIINYILMYKFTNIKAETIENVNEVS
jgi:hypothetical protein